MNYENIIPILKEWAEKNNLLNYEDRFIHFGKCLKSFNDLYLSSVELRQDKVCEVVIDLIVLGFQCNIDIHQILQHEPYNTPRKKFEFYYIYIEKFYLEMQMALLAPNHDMLSRDIDKVIYYFKCMYSLERILTRFCKQI